MPPGVKLKSAKTELWRTNSSEGGDWVTTHEASLVGTYSLLVGIQSTVCSAKLRTNPLERHWIDQMSTSVTSSAWKIELGCTYLCGILILSQVKDQWSARVWSQDECPKVPFQVRRKLLTIHCDIDEACTHMLVLHIIVRGLAKNHSNFSTSKNTNLITRLNTNRSKTYPTIFRDEEASKLCGSIRWQVPINLC